MFKTIFNYTLKTLLRKKRTFFGAVITVSLCIGLCLMMVSVTQSINTSYDMFTEDKYGQYTGLLPINSVEELNESKNNDNVSGYIHNLGCVISEKSVYDKQLSIGYVSSVGTQDCHINLIEGIWPNDYDEIVVEKSLSEKLLFEVTLNDTITLNILNQQNKKSTETFKIVGIIDDYSTVSEIKNNNVMVWPSILISKSYSDNYEGQNIYAIYNDVSSEELLNKAEKNKNIAFINPIYNANSVLYNIETSTSVILIIILVCTLLITIISIYAYLMICEGELYEQYRCLKMIGAGQKEIVLYTLLRTSAIYICSVLIGVAIGVAGSYWFSIFILEKFIDIYKYNFDMVALVVGIIIPLIMLFVVSIAKMLKVLNKRPLQVEKTKKNIKKIKLNIKNLFSKWTVVSMLNRKKTYIGIAFAMSFCFFAIFVGVMFNYTIRDEYEKEYNDTYSVRVYDGNFATSFEIPIKPYYGVSQNTIDEMLNTEQTSNISTLKVLTIIVEEETSNKDYLSFYNESVKTTSIEREDFNFITEKFNLSYESEYYRSNLFEADERLLQLLLSSEKVKGNASIEGLKSGKEIIITCSNIDKCPYKPGDSISVFQALSNEANYFSVENCLIFNPKITISAIVEIDDKNTYLGEKFFTKNGMQCVWGTGAFEHHNIELNNRYIYVNLSNAQEYDKVQAILSDIKHTYPDARIISAVDADKEKEALLNSINISVMTIAIFVFSICLFINISIIKSKYSSQKRLWGILRSIGLSKPKVLINHIKEILFIVIGAVLLNLIFLGIIDLLPFIRKDFPVISIPILSSYIISFVLVTVVTLPIANDIFKSRIIEQIEYPE